LSANWKPLVICPQPELARKVASLLTELTLEPAGVRGEYPRMGTVAAMARDQGANICFVDVATNAEHAQMLIAELAPVAPVVALHHRNDADLILRCLRRGACEYLAEPTVDAVRAVFERLTNTSRSASAGGGGSERSPGAVYCVVPGKPGCGASSLAAQLAVEVRSDAGKVLLVDGDPMNGSIAFQFKLKSEYHLGDALRDWKRMDNDLWARLVVSTTGIEVLTAPENPATRIEVSKPLAGDLCSWWRTRYAVTVLDLPDVRAAVDCGFTALADAVLLVTTNELAALQATRRALSYLDHAATDRGRLRLILNRYAPAAGLKREDVKTALKLDPFAALSNDYEVMQAALLDGRPAPSGSRFASSVHALAALLQSRGPAVTKNNGSWLGSLLHR
jgi:pilus assembly protein CpaE